MAHRLGLIEKVPETQPPIRGEPFLTARTFYQLTELGRSREDLWLNVRRSLYPEAPGIRAAYSSAARKRKRERKEKVKEATGRPVGEPAPPLTPFEQAMRERAEELAKLPVEERRARFERFEETGQRAAPAESQEAAPYREGEEKPPPSVPPLPQARPEPTGLEQRLRDRAAEELRQMSERREEPEGFG